MKEMPPIGDPLAHIEWLQERWAATMDKWERSLERLEAMPALIKEFLQVKDKLSDEEYARIVAILERMR